VQSKIPAAFDDMDGEFEARLRRTMTSSRSSSSDGREITVSSRTAVIEARFSYKVLDRLYTPSFVGIERNVDGATKYAVYEVVSVSPTHYQLSGIDSSMPTLLRKEYLDTIKESWGKSQETWIDLSAIQTNYVASVADGELTFERSPYEPLPGAQALLFSKAAVERFLCMADGERIGTMTGFDLPYTVDLGNLIRYHCGFFAFSLDYAEPMVYRESGEVKIGKIGELVDRYFRGDEEGRSYTSSVEVLAFDSDTYGVEWSPLQYVFRHRYQGKLLRFRTQTGRSVTVTPGHSLFVLRDGRIQCLSSSDLRTGDLLVGSRTVPSGEEEERRIDLLDICLTSGAKGLRLVGVPRSDYASLGYEGPYWKFWMWRSLGYLPISFHTRLRSKGRGGIRLGYKNCKNPIPLCLPVDEELASLLGYYAAEGHVVFSEGKGYSVEFTLHRTKDSFMASDIARIFRAKFGVEPRVAGHGENAIRVSVSNKILALLFANLVGKGALDKRVPPVILNSPSGVRNAFLKAWASGDYLVTCSRGLMNDVLHMFMMDGIAATVTHWSGENAAPIEGRKVNSHPRYQIWFPRAEDVIAGKVRQRRKRSEPTYPLSALPAATKSLLLRPSHLRRTNPRLSERVLEELSGGAAALRSYGGTRPKTYEAARHDGVYRSAFKRYLTVQDGAVVTTQLLKDATDELVQVRQLAKSDLTFYAIESIDEVDPTSEYVYDVSVPGLENFLAGFGGLFCHNTGSGKSNLMGTLVRKALAKDPDLRVVVFDISGEYPINLLDQLGAGARVMTTEPMESAEEFFNSQAIPESLEEAVGRDTIERALARVYKGGVEKIALEEAGGLDLGWVQTMFEGTVDGAKAGGTAAKLALGKLNTEFYEKRHMRQNTRLTELDEESKAGLVALLEEVKGNVNDRSGIFMESNQIIDMLHGSGGAREETKALTPERLATRLAKGEAERLSILYMPDPVEARQTATRLINRLLLMKKKLGNKQRILVVLDEAQEYIPDNPTDKAWTYQSNSAVEQLLRQGRKYRVHCWMATQRVARLNVNALQQLHSYFVSTLPRFYDRMVVADAFGLPIEALERSAKLETGEWIFVSFKAAKQRNVPVFLKTQNNETVVAKFLGERRN
jgi:intein/homing endonuclease